MKSGSSGCRPRVRLDRLQLAAWCRRKQLPKLEGFHLVRDIFVRRQTTVATYGRCRQYQSRSSETKIFWQYQRQAPWLADWRITLVGDDRTGLLLHHLEEVLRHCAQHRLLMLELALDFPTNCRIDLDFMERHALFGKSRPSKFAYQGQVVYGGRRSAKRIHCYKKPEVHAYRLEVQFNSRLLRATGLERVGDLAVLPRLVLKHVRFVHIDWRKLQRYLQCHIEIKHSRKVIAKTKSRAESIHAAMSYLRDQGVRNTHRYLLPLKINTEIKAAVHRWTKCFMEGLKRTRR